MAFLPEDPTWEAGIYQIETTDPVLGGPNGISNKPLKNLANRTLHLKGRVENLEASKAPLVSPGLTGTPTAPTAAVGTNTTQLATTAFVVGQAGTAAPAMAGTAAAGTSSRYARQDHVHPTDTTRAPLVSPALTGTPTAPTAAVGTNTTQLATTAFVKAAADVLQTAMNGKANAVHTHAIADVSGLQTALDGKLAVNGTAVALAGFTNSNSSNPIVGADSATQNGIGYVQNVSLFGQPDGALYTQAYSASYVAQIFQDYRTGQMAGRGKNNGAWTAWRTMLDSSNYNNYAPMKDGFGAYGTWGINITGNAASANAVPWSGVTGRPTDLGSFTNGPGYVTDAPTRAGGGAYGTWPISITGRAYPARADGQNLNFNWISKTGQPSWVVGTGGDSECHLYNPSNFSVAYAGRSSRLMRRDSGEDYSLQHHWSGTRWRLQGYQGDTYHAGAEVAYADLAGAVADIGSSKAQNGYIKVPGSNLIIQWGRIAIGDPVLDYFGSISFPIAFPNQIFQVNATPYSYAGTAFDISVGVTSHSLAGFNFTVQEWNNITQNIEVSYIAIGY